MSQFGYLRNLTGAPRVRKIEGIKQGIKNVIYHARNNMKTKTKRINQAKSNPATNKRSDRSSSAGARYSTCC